MDAARGEEAVRPRAAGLRASRSMTPPLRNDQISSHAAVTPAIVAAIGALSSKALEVLEHRAEADDRGQ